MPAQKNPREGESPPRGREHIALGNAYRRAVAIMRHPSCSRPNRNRRRTCSRCSCSLRTGNRCIGRWRSRTPRTGNRRRSSIHPPLRRWSPSWWTSSTCRTTRLRMFCRTGSRRRCSRRRSCRRSRTPRRNNPWRRRSLRSFHCDWPRRSSQTGRRRAAKTEELKFGHENTFHLVASDSPSARRRRGIGL